MALAEQELSVEVANFNGVHVNLHYHKTLLHIFPPKIMQRFVELKVLANDLHFYWSNSSWLFIKEISQGMQGQGRETHTDTEGHRERRHCFVLFCF